MENLTYLLNVKTTLYFCEPECYQNIFNSAETPLIFKVLCTRFFPSSKICLDNLNFDSKCADFLISKVHTKATTRY